MQLFLKTVGVVGSYSECGACLKCIVIGEWDIIGRHMSYPKTDCNLRTDKSFRDRVDEDHHKQRSPLEDLPINMVDDIIIADSLHLVDLGNIIH